MNDSIKPQDQQGPSLQQLLDRNPTKKWPSRGLWLVGAGLILAALVLMFLRAGADQAIPQYTTAPAEIGTLVVKVSATGNLQPTNQV